MFLQMFLLLLLAILMAGLLIALIMSHLAKEGICSSVFLNLEVDSKAWFYELMISVPMSFLLRVLKSHMLATVVILLKSQDKESTPEFAHRIKSSELKHSGFVNEREFGDKLLCKEII